MSQAWSPEPASGDDASLGTLVKQLSEQSTRLIRDELRLAQTEMADKAKQAGKGAGLAAAAGVVALFGVGALIATVISLLALVLHGWLAGLIVTVVLFAVGGVLALIGKEQIDQVGPIAPSGPCEPSKPTSPRSRTPLDHDRTHPAAGTGQRRHRRRARRRHRRHP